MNIKQALIDEHSKAQKDRIADYVGHDTDRFETFMRIFLHGEKPLPQRAAWCLDVIYRNNPIATQRFFPELIERLADDSAHDAVHRNILKIFESEPIDVLGEELQGKLIDLCFGFLASPQRPIAIRAYSMTVLYKFCELYPELGGELKLLIEENMKYGSAGIKSRGRKVLKALKKL
ncbi:hypothetical protein [Halocola ammonii]